jgi:exosortase/archaeosortase family protein
MNIFHKWKQVPKPVNAFLLKGLLVFIIWKSLYLFFFLPGRILDAPLTYAVGAGTTRMLNFMTNSQIFSAKNGMNEFFEGNKRVRIEYTVVIEANHEKALAIADVCNGLELMVLYLGFIICFPSGISRKLIFAFTGIALIYLFNVLRCSSLILIYLHYPSYLDFSHHYLFKFLVYGFIFLLWHGFTQKLAFINARAAA